ncbi:MAG: penicillin-binding protein [Nitrospirae bacterium]|nr:penicillin-binding protein [Candidatus Manganitrophaceae bacterium]
MRAAGGRGVWVAGLIVFGLVSLLFLEGGGLGGFFEDPLQNTPFALVEEGVRIKGALPPLDHTERGKYVSRFPNGVTAVYTYDAALQQAMENYFKRYGVPYGVFVAMDPNTGRVLASVEYSADNPRAEHLALRATYPAASIFKLVTASAAIEEKKANPETEITYHGGLYRMGPRNWIDNPKRDKLKITIADALAKSCNVAFAKIALRWLDVPTLQSYAERFQFNRAIPFELPMQVSRMEIENSERGLARTAAGFGEVGLSPLHGAMIGSAIANDGIMMSPCMIDQLSDANGTKLYECQPKIFSTVISAETAQSLREMMAMTVIKGTSRKAFRLKRRGATLRGITIGGKTGSLTGEDPPGKYSWFVGMAPLEDPEIVVAVMLINHSKWKIKASQAAREGFDAYFQGENLRKVANQ